MTEAESPNSQSPPGRPGWSRTATSTRPVSPLCETCQSLLDRPACDPATQLGVFRAGDQFSIPLYYAEASRAAANGCVLCKVVMALQAVCAERAEREADYWDPPRGFELKLRWSSTASQFASIEMYPLDCFLSQPMFLKAGPMYRISLTPQGGTFSPHQKLHETH